MVSESMAIYDEYEVHIYKLFVDTVISSWVTTCLLLRNPNNNGRDKSCDAASAV